MTRWEPPREPWSREYRRAVDEYYKWLRRMAEPFASDRAKLRNQLLVMGFNPPESDGELQAFEEGRIQALRLITRNMFRSIKHDDYAQEYHGG